MVSAVALEAGDASLCCLLAAGAIPVLRPMLANKGTDGQGESRETELILDVSKCLENMVWEHFAWLCYILCD